MANSRDHSTCVGRILGVLPCWTWSEVTFGRVYFVLKIRFFEVLFIVRNSWSFRLRGANPRNIFLCTKTGRFNSVTQGYILFNNFAQLSSSNVFLHLHFFNSLLEKVCSSLKTNFKYETKWVISTKKKTVCRLSLVLKTKSSRILAHPHQFSRLLLLLFNSLSLSVFSSSFFFRNF